MRRAALMKIVGVAASAAIALLGRSAHAQNFETCCDTEIRASGSCVAQASPCGQSSGFAVGLSSLSPSAVPADWSDDSGVLGAYHGAAEGDAAGPSLGVVGIPFPSGVDGYMATTTKPPWTGLCLDAPAPEDPMHEGPTEPIGCVTLSLLPGVSAQLATYQFPVDPRWDAYQLCYGVPSSANALAPCENVNDSNDPSVSPSPVTGSCCGPAHVLAGQNAASPQEWSVAVSQEIPGVPPPVLVLGPDGGPTVLYDPDAGDLFAAVPDTCLTEYGEPVRCGQPPATTDATLPAVGPCVPTTCAAQGVSCGIVSNGCGATIECTNCSAEEKGTLSCSTTTPGAAGVAARVGALAAVLAIGCARWRQRRTKRALYARTRQRDARGGLKRVQNRSEDARARQEDASL